MYQLRIALGLSIFFSLLLWSCDNQSTNTSQNVPNTKLSGQATFVGNKQFDEYWYRGEAELNSYTLEQARYGEIHEGEAVLVFVTEPFSRSKQVKLDDPGLSPEDMLSVMKLNLTKKFYTGVYPYSIMQSSFTPVDWENFPNSLKVSTSTQEWCGHTFTQLNHNDKGYRLQSYSYFESEGDREQQLGQALLEDEIWSKIRINPKSLPTGKIDLIPGTVHSRLRHQDVGVVKATASLKSAEDDSQSVYEIDLGQGKRNLKIYFNKAFPHQIQGWEEKMLSGFGSGAKPLLTKATLKKSIQLDYWNRNRNIDAKYREALELN